MTKRTKRKIAIIGGTGLVGTALVQILSQHKVSADYMCFGRTVGKTVVINEETYLTQELTRENIKNFGADYAIFTAGSGAAILWAHVFADHGAVVIDNSSAFRRDAGVPLVIPECNAAPRDARIISNPNCSTIIALLAIKPLDDAFKVKKIVYTTYQAISGAGANPVFAHTLDNNIIPFIDGEEEKMIFETKKILARNDIDIHATCVRVPISNCHSVSIYAEFEKAPSFDAVNAVLGSAPGVNLHRETLPMPINADGVDDIQIGRVRVRGNAVEMFVVGDNLRKGAALNAVQILKCLM